MISVPEHDPIEQKRHECEVRWVAGMKSKRERVEYLAGVHEKRGQRAYDRIIEWLKVFKREKGNAV